MRTVRLPRTGKRPAPGKGLSARLSTQRFTEIPEEAGKGGASPFRGERGADPHRKEGKSLGGGQQISRTAAISLSAAAR
ncbi:hypothetical protein GCM10023324_47270 [Streptomyces youssoufiensis]